MNEIINKKLKNSQIFNKILITGNSNVNLKQILKLLNNNIKKAKKLKTYNMSPQKLGKTILNAKDNTKNLEIPKYYESLIADFFISNINKKIWAWYDKHSLFILDYWKQIDNKLFFILVYESPIIIIKKLLKEKKSLIEIENNLQQWKKEIDIMLEFYYQNKERCIIVNSSNIIQDKSIILKKTDLILNQNNDNIINYLIYKYLEDDYLILDKFEEIQTFSENPYYIKNIEINYLEIVSKLMTAQGELEKIYLEKEDKDKKIKSMQNNLNNEINKNKILNKQKFELENNLTKIEKEKDLLLSQLMTTQEELEKIYLEKEDKDKKIKSMQNNLNNEINKNKILNKQKFELENNLTKIEKEKDLLLSQLMITQEELEKIYLKNKKLEEKIEKKKHYYGATDRIKSQLSYKLGSKMIEIAKNKPLLLPFLPFILLKVRREYKEYMKNRTKLPPIHMYVDYYEAERMKKHLSYMLGKTTINTLKNNPFGIFILPFKLQKTYKKFKVQKR